MTVSLRKWFVMGLAVLLIAAPQVAMASDIDQGRMDGERDGKSDVSQWLWMGAGCLFNLLGIGAAYIIVPSAPATRLLGKSSEYTAAYTEAYQNGARGSQVRNAVIGCVVGTVAYSLFYLFYWLLWLSVW